MNIGIQTAKYNLQSYIKPVKTYRNRLLHVILPVLLGCNPGAEPDYKLPSDSDINAVVQTVIEEKWNVLRSERESSADKNKSAIETPVSSQLRHLSVINDIRPKGDTNIYLYASDYLIGLEQLFSYKSGRRKIFFPKDSEYLFFQSKHLKSHTLSRPDTARYTLTTAHTAENPGAGAFYDVSIPLFTKDNKYCYVAVTYNSPDKYGHRSYFILHKSKSRWRVIDNGMEW